MSDEPGPRLEAKHPEEALDLGIGPLAYLWERRGLHSMATPRLAAAGRIRVWPHAAARAAGRYRSGTGGWSGVPS